MNYVDFFRNKGFIYSDETLTNFVLSLKTKPFVILSGISGSGKSKIAQISAEFLVEDLYDQYAFMSVKPSWKDSKDLLGYHNVITGEYETTEFLKLMIRATQNPEKPYFLLLDEMNLAKVEHYFADFLSCLESRYYVENDTQSDTTLTITEIGTNLDNIYTTKPTLSVAIILAALDLKHSGINIHEQHLPIKDYRINTFSNWWKSRYSEGEESNWTPQFRTEINQGTNRLANRFLEGGNGAYRLKRKEELSAEDQKKYEEIENNYYAAKEISRKSYKIVQEPIILHSKDNQLLSSDSNVSSSKIINGNYSVSHLYDKATGTYYIPSKMDIPLNLFVIGTVNIDESTYMFSPKVLDRANLIEFNDVNISSIFGTATITSQPYKLQNNPILLPLRLARLQVTQNLVASNPSVMNDLQDVFKLLEKYNLHFGYRVINEMSLYITNAQNYIEDYPDLVSDAFDFQLLQKVLPKFNGSIQKLWDPFVDILSIIRKSSSTPLQDDEVNNITAQLFNKELVNVLNEDYLRVFKYPRTAKKLLMLLRNLEKNGFTSFIE